MYGSLDHGSSPSAPLNEESPLLAHDSSQFRPPEQEDEPFLQRVKSASSHQSYWLAPDAYEAEEESPPEDGGVNEGTEPYMAGVSKTQFRLMFGGILFQYFVAMFDSTLMASSHPVITSYFHASNAASWLSTAFLLTSTAFQPLFGRMSDTFGRRGLYLFSLIMFAVTTAWCALAQSIGSFIAARAVCGLGAGGILAMGSIMTNDLVRIEVRGTYQAYINLFFGLGSACGAAFGGFLCDALGWRWTFGIQLPFILAILILAIFVTPRSLGPHLAKNTDKSTLELIKSFDLLGSFLLTLTVSALVLGLNLGGNVYPWTHPVVLASLVVSLITAPLLIRVELKSSRPVLPIPMLWTAPRGHLIFSNFFATIGINTIIFNAPLFFQAVMLDSPSASGLRLAIPSLSLTVCGVASGFIMTATGRITPLLIAGAVAMLLGAVLLSTMQHGIPPALATAFVVPASLGQGLAFPATSLGVLVASEQSEQAVVTSMLSLWRSLGTVMGVAISSLVLQNALTLYLTREVTGVDREDIIRLVRKSVNAVRGLDGVHQAEVISAYEQSLRLTFISAIAMFVVVNVLILFVRLPRLGGRGNAPNVK